MSNGDRLFIKNLNIDPPSVPNDGSGEVRAEAVVFTAAEGASITAVSAAINLPGAGPIPMEPDLAAFLVSSGEGRYLARIRIPLLTDPGVYTVTIRAGDSDGNTAEVARELAVNWKRPPLPLGPLAADNPATLASLAAANLSEGNRVEALNLGADSFARRMELIESARRQINLQTYALDADGNCGKMIEAIRRKADEGVEVNVILNLDSQLAVSARAALALGLDRVGRDLREWIRSVDQSLTEGGWFRELTSGIREALDRPGAGAINLIFADDSAILGAAAPAPLAGRPVWLAKMDDEAKQKSGDERRRPTGRGPGGLPALPLLSYAVHEKIMVVDGRRAIVGGRNLEDRYFDHWIDRDLYLEGPVVDEVQAGFCRSFSEFAKNLGRPDAVTPLPQDHAPVGSATALFTQSRPWDNEFGPLHFLVSACQMARRRIWISSQYLVLPDSLLRDALLDAAARGIEVKILTNSYATIQEVGIAAGYFISLHYLEPLLKAGVRVFELNGPGGEGQSQAYLHAKEFLIDGELAMIGSVNLSIRSCYIESENLVGVFDPGFTSQQEQLFAELIAGATEIDTDYFTRQRLLFRSKISLARYLELLY